MHIAFDMTFLYNLNKEVIILFSFSESILSLKISERNILSNSQSNLNKSGFCCVLG